jgi:hypothetical protein
MANGSQPAVGNIPSWVNLGQPVGFKYNDQSFTYDPVSGNVYNLNLANPSSIPSATWSLAGLSTSKMAIHQGLYQAYLQAVKQQQQQQQAQQGGQTTSGQVGGGSYYQYNPATASYQGMPGPAAAPSGYGGGTPLAIAGAPNAIQLGLGGSQAMAATTPAGTTARPIPLSVNLPEWQQWYGQNLGKSVLVNGALQTIGTDIGPDALLAAFRNQSVGFGQSPIAGQSGPAAPTYFGPGANAAPPESAALAQMAQIDPATEAARQALAGSIAQPGLGAANMLGLWGQVDPRSLAMAQQLGQQIGGNLALGSTLDPTTQMQIEQAARAAQGARGNVYGVAPAVAEALTQGQAGLALQQARQQAAQSYLASGVSPGSTALNLLRNQQQATLNYLGSGQTPYQAGAGYLANAIGQANQAAAGGPVYQPTGITQTPTPYSYLNPTYGLSMGQQANQMYNSMLQSYGMQQAGAGPNRGMGAAAGALGGAASGALMGSAAGGIGAIPGALIGAVGGAASGYFG